MSHKFIKAIEANTEDYCKLCGFSKAQIERENRTCINSEPEKITSEVKKKQPN